MSELEKALKDMNKGKSPGMDGIPPEFYLAFWPALGPLMVEMTNYAVDKGSFGRHTNTAVISLLLKKEKDPESCSSYHPLSLLGSDMKLQRYWHAV